MVAKIGDKYYALTIPPKGKYGREYEKFMILGEITANEKGEFTLKTLEDNGVMMLTTGFCAPSGGDLALSHRKRIKNQNSVHKKKSVAILLRIATPPNAIYRTKTPSFVVNFRNTYISFSP